MTLNTPPIKLYVNRSYLTDFQENGFELAYLVAVNAINNKPLYFTVHLESGALYSKLPIEAIYCDKYMEEDFLDEVEIKYNIAQLQPFSCLEGPAQLIVYNHLRDSDCICRIGTEKLHGNYLFTVDYLGDGFASDPEQYKSHNVVVLETGQLAALPNNHVLFTDKFFTNQEVKWPGYRRQSKYYFSE